MEIGEVNLKNIQLIATTALLIASKTEEIYPPELRDFYYISDKLYLKNDLVLMEYKILNSLNFDIIFASTYKFLSRIHVSSMLDGKETFFVAQYFIEMSLSDSLFNSKKSSLKAASAYYLALKITKELHKFHNCMGEIEEICGTSASLIKATITYKTHKS